MTKNSSTVPGKANRPTRSSAARKPSARISAGPRGAAGGRCRRARPAYKAADAVVDHANELETGKVGEGPHAHTAFGGSLHHFAHGNADREGTAVARRDDAIAALHARHTLQQHQPHLGRVIAGQDGTLA